MLEFLIAIGNVKVLAAKFTIASVAQWIRHWPPKPGIAGSSPAGGWSFQVSCDVNTVMFTDWRTFEVVSSVHKSFYSISTRTARMNE